MHFLEIRKANTFYGDFHVLKDVSIFVQKGEILSIVGANTAGKSSLINAISGLIPLKSGEIFFNSTKISGLQPYEIPNFGVIQVPEGRKIFPLMTVLENLLIGSTMTRARNKRSESLEYVFGLFPVLYQRRKQLGGTLSGGEQQLLAIARGLMAMPKLLLLDEPSIGLSPLFAENIFKVINEINNNGITILLVEQNVQKSLSIAHRAYVLEGGRITMEGTGKNLLSDPYVKDAYLGL